MNTIKHTPGPWFIQPEQDGAFTIWAGETQLGEVQPDDMGDVLPAEANARLIAEAPAMLAALREIAFKDQRDGRFAEIANCILVRIDGN